MSTLILAAAVVWIAVFALLVVAAIRAVDRSENRRLLAVAAQLADLRRMGLTVVPLPAGRPSRSGDDGLVQSAVSIGPTVR